MKDFAERNAVFPGAASGIGLAPARAEPGHGVSTAAAAMQARFGVSVACAARVPGAIGAAAAGRP